MPGKEPVAEEVLASAKVARMATVDGEGRPHIIPVVFVFHEGSIFIPLDEKEKRVRPEELKRVRNIWDNPNVALLIDEYSDDWSKLFYMMIPGKARIIGREEENLLAEVHELLRAKYPQYEKVGIGTGCIAVRPDKMIAWGNKTPLNAS